MVDTQTVIGNLRPMEVRKARLQQALPIVRVVEEEPPTIVYTDVADFRSVVQNLTGCNISSGTTHREPLAYAYDKPFQSTKDYLIVEDDCNRSSRDNTEAVITFSGEHNCSSITSKHFPENETQSFSKEVNNELHNLRSPFLSHSQPFDCWELSIGHCGSAMEDVSMKDIQHVTSRPPYTYANEEYSFSNVQEGEDNLSACQHSLADDDMVQEIMGLITSNAENHENWTLPATLSDDQDFLYFDAYFRSEISCSLS
ncbi:hypothetical protein KP509_08G035300 [Ceratopteris richardii]|uniref:VQ domain-containing protein n=1 Tax=Ceratopteris richardii TaxID=49495 RepID=A0A8T2U916_CERRI|nr:hypothetical protein KP509_08G035300 [Ceratopteris richardii]